MTRSRFDKLFAAGELCIRADYIEQWFEINDYARTQLSRGTSSAYFSHDCASYPFIFCVDTIVDASNGQNGRPVISFAEFWAIIHEEETAEEELPCITLEGVF